MKNFYRISLFLLFFAFTACGPVDPASDSSRLLAYSYAEDYVKEQLKSPSSAKFATGSEKLSHVKYMDDHQYEIKSWVESTNSFNALIRTQFEAVIWMDQEKNSIRLVSLDIE